MEKLDPIPQYKPGQQSEPIPNYESMPEVPVRPPPFSWDDKVPGGIRVEDVGINGKKYKRVVIRNRRPVFFLIFWWLLFSGLSTFIFLWPTTEFNFVSLSDTFNRRDLFTHILLGGTVLLVTFFLLLGVIKAWKTYYTIEIDEKTQEFTATVMDKVNDYRVFSPEDSDYEFIFESNNHTLEFSGNIRLKRPSALPFYIESVSEKQGKWLGRLLFHLLKKPPRKWIYFISWRSYFS